MREMRMFTVLAVGALILAMAALLAAPAQAGTPRGEVEFKAPPSATRDQGSDGGLWSRRSRTVGGAAAIVVAAAALSSTATQRTKAATT
jgi:hypothetical protein